MRIAALAILSFSSFLSAGASAQDWKSLMATDHEARWNACYKETRLIHRTRNMSEQQYRMIIKEARRNHMNGCMARVEPPRPIAVPDITDKMRPAQIAGWSANP